MTTTMPNLAFNGMSLIFKVRDLFRPRRGILEKVGLRPSDRVLDFGCGPGGYVRDTAEMVGESGTVYALDIHPLSAKRVHAIAARHGLNNVETIRSNCQTGLPDESLDVVFLYDVFHMLDDPEAVLAEMHRVLKPDGLLSFNDHHMREEDILTGMTDSGLFALAEKNEKTYSFVRRQLAQPPAL